MKYNIIVCVDNENGISKNNIIPWKNKNDMQYFKNKTTKTKCINKKNVIIMGYNTYKYCGVLPNRINILLTKNHYNEIYPDTINLFNSIENIINYCDDLDKSQKIENIYIISGSLYPQFLNLKIIDNVYINQINMNYQCDNFFNFSDYKNDYIFDKTTQISSELINNKYKKKNKNNCFAKDTLVFTNNGYKLIQKLKINNYVISHKNIPRKILNIKINNHKSSMVYLYNELSNIPIQVTKEHPFLINNLMWVKSNDIDKTNHKLTINLIKNNNNILIDLFYVFGYCYKSYDKNNCTVLISKPAILKAINEILVENGYKKLIKQYNYIYLINDINLVHRLNFITNNDNFYKIVSEMNIQSIKYFINGYYDACVPELYFHYPQFDLIHDMIKSHHHREFYEYDYNRCLFLQYLSFYLYDVLHITRILYNGEFFYKLTKIKNTFQSNSSLLVLLVNITEKKLIKRNTKIYNLEVEMDNTYIINNIITHNCNISQDI